MHPWLRIAPLFVKVRLLRAGGNGGEIITLILVGRSRTGTVTPTIPPRIDYELTKLGIFLRKPWYGHGHNGRFDRSQLER